MTTLVFIHRDENRFRSPSSLMRKVITNNKCLMLLVCGIGFHDFYQTRQYVQTTARFSLTSLSLFASIPLQLLVSFHSFKCLFFILEWLPSNKTTTLSLSRSVSLATLRFLSWCVWGLPDMLKSYCFSILKHCYTTPPASSALCIQTTDKWSCCILQKTIDNTV